MSSAAPTPGPRDAKPRTEPKTTPVPALSFDDPLDRQSPDDTDRGWGERPSGDSAAELARFLDEKPPHHV